MHKDGYIFYIACIFVQAKALLEAAFGIKCSLGDGMVTVDVEAFTYMRKRHNNPFSTWMFVDADDLEPKLDFCSVQPPA